LNQPPSVLETARQFCQAFGVQKAISAIVQNPAARAAVLIALVVPISFYLGTSPVRREILYYAGIFAPSLVAAIAAGLSAWSWQWFWIVLLIGVALTALIQAVLYAFG
jgi:hypothetical protein